MGGQADNLKWGELTLERLTKLLFDPNHLALWGRVSLELQCAKTKNEVYFKTDNGGVYVQPRAVEKPPYCETCFSELRYKSPLGFRETKQMRKGEKVIIPYCVNSQRH